MEETKAKILEVLISWEQAKWEIEEERKRLKEEESA